MSFSQTNAAIENERIICLTGIGCHCLTSGMREFVIFTNNKITLSFEINGKTSDEYLIIALIKQLRQLIFDMSIIDAPCMIGENINLPSDFFKDFNIAIVNDELPHNTILMSLHTADNIRKISWERNEKK